MSNMESIIMMSRSSYQKFDSHLDVQSRSLWKRVICCNITISSNVTVLETVKAFMIFFSENNAHLREGPACWRICFICHIAITAIPSTQGYIMYFTCNTLCSKYKIYYLLF